MNPNKVELIGHLSADPRKGENSGDPPVTFSLVTTRYVRPEGSEKREKRSEIHIVVAYGNLAKLVSKYMQGGDHVYLEGRRRTRPCLDEKRRHRTCTEIVASMLILLGGKSKSRASEEAAEVSNKATK